MPSRQLLVVLTCLASLLGVAHWFERPSAHQLQTPFPTGPLVAAATRASASPEEEPPSTTDKRAEAEQCTIVFIHNRKGCVFDRRAHLREAGADAAIPNRQPIPLAGPTAAKAWGGGGDLGWAAAAALGSGGQGPVIPELVKRRPKGEAYGPPQTTVWRVR